MIKRIISVIAKWIEQWFWVHPISKPVKEKPIRMMGEQVFDDYTVIKYDGQRINLHKSELKLWNDKRVYPRKDKRATARKFREQEQKGLIRFEEINGKLICLKNKDYQRIAEKNK